ncbi:MAG: HEAT repeat domain-containing protein, partial [Phycisphaeraceae bacterium]|nr:HEAT repeat domain-containing protein [Phycisphaeraceae bacterium]
MTCKPYVSVIAAIVLLASLPPAQGLTIESAMDTLKTHQFGQHTDVLDFLRESASRAQTDPVTRQTINQGCTEILQSDASYAAKLFVCRLLVLTATEQQIPVLDTCLSDPEMSHMTLSVLVHLHDPAVDTLLITALETARGRARLGIITALGNRRSAGAVTSLASLLDSDQQGVTAEAALALGRVGAKKSATVLNRFVSQYQGALPGKVADAMLVCADHLAVKEPGTAQAMYRLMLDKRHPSATRCAALIGLARLPGPESLASILTALRGEDIQLRQTAAQLARTLPEPDMATALARQLNTLTPGTQVLVIKALGVRGDAATMQGIRAAAAHASVEVRIAALNALASLGDESVIRLLADRAVQSAPLEQAAAKHALATLAGNRINGEMVTQLKLAPPAQQVVLIEALAKRQALEAAPTLLALTQNNTRPVRTASLTALGALGSRDQIAGLAERLIHNDSLQEITGQTLVQIALRTGGSEDASQSLLEGLKTAKTRPLRTTLLSTLGQLKHDSALGVLSAALKDTDEAIRYNAIKALSAWPNASPAPSLLAVARTNSNRTHQILALRGYIRLVAQSTLTAPQKIEHYQRAMTLAAVAEKKNILAKLPDLQSTESLRMA